MRSPGIRTTAGRAVTVMQQALCVVQISLGVALLAAASLLAHSLWRLSAGRPASTPQLGIRMALGANRAAILGLVLSQGLRLSVIGVAIGLGLAVAGTRALQSLLFEVRATDPLTLAAASAVVIMVTLVASYAPAYRASRLNPLTALRHE